MKMQRPTTYCFALIGMALVHSAAAGADDWPVTIDYVHYRPASYETEHVTEKEDEHPNRGGLVYVYYTNRADKTVRLNHWRWNEHDESTWRLDNVIRWDRASHTTLAPGQMGVLEISAPGEDFAAGKPYRFGWVSRDTWQPVARADGELRQDPVSIPLIRFHPDLKTLDVHVRYRADEPSVLSESSLRIESLEVVGRTVSDTSWVGQDLARSGHAIARVVLATPLTPSELCFVRVGVRGQQDTRYVYAHRRAFADFFPIGTWGAPADRYVAQRQHHIDTCVAGGSASDPFFARDAQQYGYRAILSVGYQSIDQLRTLAGHPAVACQMIEDEPDWDFHPQKLMVLEEMIRHFNPTAPTMTTLCRNVKFFDYAPLVDLPCMDHYCVTAPSSSSWPHRWGTRLEETGYYTRDLKLASEPKPIWIWSQGLFDWSQRPGQTVPTPGELAVQLVQNLANGAKGILWFTFREQPGEEYPETRAAMQGWGRVLRLVRDDLLGAEPYAAGVEAAAETGDKADNKVDIATLVTRDKLLVMLTNRDYQLDPKGYRFTSQQDVRVTLRLPDWIQPKDVVELSPAGVRSVEFEAVGNKLTIEAGELIDAQVLVVCHSADATASYRAAQQQIVADETRDWGTPDAAEN